MEARQSGLSSSIFDVVHIRLFFGEVEVENLSSIRCLEKAGFRLRSSEPDFEGMLRYSRESSRRG
jgi:RimJ/RimL family protein N-acetyltransferase